MEIYGSWKKDKKEGNGNMIYNNGDVYDGTWKNDKKYNGLMKYKNGDEYEEKK